MTGFAKGLMAFFLPGGLVLLAAVGFLRPHGLPGWLQSPVSAIPYIVLFFGLVFGWYLSNTRLILSVLILAGAERALTIFPVVDPSLTSIGQRVFDLTAFLLPLNLLALSKIKTDATSAARNVIRLLLLCAQA